MHHSVDLGIVKQDQVAAQDKQAHDWFAKQNTAVSQPKEEFKASGFLYAIVADVKCEIHQKTHKHVLNGPSTKLGDMLAFRGENGHKIIRLSSTSPMEHDLEDKPIYIWTNGGWAASSQFENN